MISILHDVIWEEIRELHLLAFRLKEQFDQHQELAAIRAAWQPLRAKQERLEKKLPEVVLQQQGQYQRHFYWLEKRLREEQPDSCYDDLAALCFSDIPALEQAYLAHLLGSGPIVTMNWEAVHPLIRPHAQSRFETHHYADAVEAAFKQINSFVKQAYREAGGEERERDGDDLMRNAFSYQRNPRTHAVERMPRLRLTDRDLATDSGFNVQDGYMNLFSGAMRGIRNPKAHDNVTIDAAEAWEMLLFASHLLRMLDRGLRWSSRNG
jgi:uncharacterized protein (TIGR02391 family)